MNDEVTMLQGILQSNQSLEELMAAFLEAQTALNKIIADDPPPLGDITRSIVDHPGVKPVDIMTEDEKAFQLWLKNDPGAADYYEFMTGTRPQGYASGGLAMPGWAMVGEQGPELVHLPRGSKVDTATATRREVKAIASGAGGSSTQNVTINVNGYNQNPAVLANTIRNMLAKDNLNRRRGLNPGI
jgi:hypothetical protein